MFCDKNINFIPMTQNRTLNFEFQEHSYSMEFPNNQQYLTIHNLKASLLPQYDLLETMGSESSYATVLADAIAHFTVLSPKLIEDLNKPISQLPMEIGVELVGVYSEIVRPWYNDWLNLLFKPKETIEEKNVVPDKIDKLNEG